MYFTQKVRFSTVHGQASTSSFRTVPARLASSETKVHNCTSQCGGFSTVQGQANTSSFRTCPRTSCKFRD